jgi:hypothetical protein
MPAKTNKGAEAGATNVAGGPNGPPGQENNSKNNSPQNAGGPNGPPPAGRWQKFATRRG